jgi:Lipoprotein confined to pathogenic Mycobacterium
MMIRLAGGILGMVVACMSVFGCGAPDPGTHGDPGRQRVAELENGLRSKPPFEAAQTEYATAMNQMATQIAALVPGMAWHVADNSWNHCGGVYVWTRAVRVYYYIVFDRAVPDDAWPRALQIVEEGAARFGAKSVNVLVDRPGNKDLVIYSSDGVQFEFGTKVQTIFSATSDCRMRSTDTPTSTPTSHP